MPVKLSLEFVSVVGPNSMNAKRESFDHMIDKINGILLCMSIIDFKCPYPRGIINGCVLESSDFSSFFAFQFEELDINLYVMTRNLLFIAMCQYRSTPFIPGKTIDSMPLQYSIYSDLRNLKSFMIALNILVDPLGS